MNRRVSAWRGLSVRAGVFGAAALAAGLLLGAAGCAHQQARLQSDDDGDAAGKYDVRTVGDVSQFANPDPLPVGGVGLVVGLGGTGGDAPPSGYRTMLEEELKRQQVKNIKELMASTDVALVIVTAEVPAGARKGDPLDLVVSLPEGSKARSLRGGYLKECVLFNYDFTKNLSPASGGGNRPVMGHPVAKAEGAVLVGFGDGDDAAKVRQGRIWGGGRSKIDRPFYLLLNPGQQQARLAGAAAERINTTFHGPFRGGPNGDTAAAKNREIVVLSAPHHYRLNLPRYLRVVRLIPLNAQDGGKGAYRQRLEQELLDPARAVAAALRLEALGADTVPSLKKGLESDHPLVRFCAAEALAYLGSPSCGEELARCVEKQPALRAFSLTALASLDEAVSHVKLRELLTSSDAETRYGAFRALRALDERDPAVQGDLLNESFWVHRVAPTGEPLVHVSSRRRAEVVLFGEDAYLKPPFQFLAGEFAVTSGQDDSRCTVSRFSVQDGASRRQCSLRVEDVLKTLAEQGGTYAEATELLAQADKCRCVSCPVRADALPQATTVYELAKAGRDNPQPGDEEVIRLQLDLGATPNLLADAPSRRSPAARAENALLRDKAKEDVKTSERKTKTGR